MQTYEEPHNEEKQHLSGKAAVDTFALSLLAPDRGLIPAKNPAAEEEGGALWCSVPAKRRRGGVVFRKIGTREKYN